MKKLILTFLCVCVAFPAFSADKESAYERVMKTQTIRCGYGTFHPWIYQDLQSGDMKGFNVDVAKALADQLGFELDWSEEASWGTLPESLYTGRIDVACSLLWIDPARSKQVAYTRPLFFQPVYAYAREDDTRFTGDSKDVNTPAIRIAVQEGDVTAALATRDFPLAQTMTSPQSVPSSNLLLDVTSGKADVVFSDPLNVESFNAAQEKKLKKIPLPAPLTIYGSAFAVGIHELELRQTLDATAAYMIDNGVIDALAAEFNKQHPGAVIPAQKSYEVPR